jgi:lipopolysaccharide transport system ATP-binding protein
MRGDARIGIQGVSVFFPLYHGSSRSLKKTVMAAASGRLGKDMQHPNLGMSVELTGRENVLLRGLYNRLSRPEISRLEEDVATFAELGDFMDLPVRTYSSGMVMRLGFAMATAIRPQILLMDEWFMVGDAEFREKAQVRLENMVRGAEILVISTHDTSVVRNWCTRVLWLDQGRIHLDGSPDEVLEAYLGHPLMPLEAERV